MPLTFKPKLKSDIDWSRIDEKYLTVFQSKNWINYYERAGIQHFILAVYYDSIEIGYVLFSSRRLLLYKHIGSPLPGTGTGFGGLVTYRGADSIFDTYKLTKASIYNELLSYISTRASYGNLSDLNLRDHEPIQLESNQFKLKFKLHYFLDLTPAWEDIFKTFKDKSCRYEYRKGLKQGLSVRFNWKSDEFINFHYQHITNVYARKHLTPTFSKSRLKNMIDALSPEEYLLAACMNEQELPVASCIIIFNKNCGFLTTAACLDSWLGRGANELLMVEAIREVKNKGVSKLEFGGGMKYKEKYGTEAVQIPIFEYSSPFNINYSSLKKVYNSVRKNSIIRILLKVITR